MKYDQDKHAEEDSIPALLGYMPDLSTMDESLRKPLTSIQLKTLANIELKQCYNNSYVRRLVSNLKEYGEVKANLHETIDYDLENIIASVNVGEQLSPVPSEDHNYFG